jgi:hypothetical protein
MRTISFTFISHYHLTQIGLRFLLQGKNVMYLRTTGFGFPQNRSGIPPPTRTGCGKGIAGKSYMAFKIILLDFLIKSGQ